MADTATKRSAAEERKLVKTAQERFQRAQEAESKNRTVALEDVRFLFVPGEQWLQTHRAKRESQGRPCLTVNRLLEHYHQVSNDQRQNRQAIRVSPVDDKADPKTAEILQGVIRHIEYESNADTAYDTAFDCAAAGGWGYFRLVTKFERPDSFDQCIRFERIPNPFQVYMDPEATEPDGSDAQFCFITTDLKEDEYNTEYPDSDVASGNWEGLGDYPAGWLGKDGIRVVEYYYLERVPETLVELLSPEGPISVYESDLEKMPGWEKAFQRGRERETERIQVKWCKLNAVEVLDETDIPGEFIPVFRVVGDEVTVDGERQYAGIVRHAKDPQRHYNFMISESANRIGLSNKAPYIGAKGQFEGFENQWRRAHIENFPYLEYNPRDFNGVPIGPPTINMQEPAIQAITVAQETAADNIKATTGIYNAALGQKSNESSGRAIIARQQESDTANFHFLDNLNRARKQAGRVCLAWIPVYYKRARVMRIIGEDGQQSTVKVNQELPGQQGPDGQPMMYDLAHATGYDVTMSSGPSFQTKRQQAAESTMGLVQAFPQIAQIAGDILVGALDLPYADKIAERLKKTLPPELRDADEGQPQIPPQVLQVMAEMKQKHQALNEYAKQLEAKSNEFEQKKELALIDRDTQMAMLQLKLDSQEAIALLKTEVDAMKSQMNMNAKAAAQEAGEAAQAM